MLDFTAGASNLITLVFWRCLLLSSLLFVTAPATLGTHSRVVLAQRILSLLLEGHVQQAHPEQQVKGKRGSIVNRAVESMHWWPTC